MYFYYFFFFALLYLKAIKWLPENKAVWHVGMMLWLLIMLWCGPEKCSALWLLSGQLCQAQIIFMKCRHSWGYSRVFIMGDRWGLLRIKNIDSTICGNTFSGCVCVCVCALWMGVHVLPQYNFSLPYKCVSARLRVHVCAYVKAIVFDSWSVVIF